MAKVGRPKNPPTCECYAEEVARRRQRRGKNKNLFTVNKFVKTSDYVMRDQNITSIQLIAELAYYHGYGYLFCSTVTLIDSTMEALTSKKGLLATFAASKLAQLIVGWLTQSKLKKLPLINWLSAFMVLVIVVAQKTYEAIDGVILNINAKREVLDLMRQACQHLRTNYGDSKSGFVDVEKNKSEIEELTKFIEAEAKSNEIVQFIEKFSLSDLIADIFKTGDMKTL